MRRGGVIRRGSSWGYRAEISRPGEPRRQIRKSGFRTQKEAQRALNELLHSQDTGTFVAPTAITLGEYLHDWLESLPARGLRPKTLETYRSMMGHHVIPYLGAIRLQNLTALDLDRLYARLLAEGGVLCKGSGLSARTVRIAHVILRKALHDAERKGLVQRNVADLASPPSNKAAKPPEAEVWTTEQLRQFLAGIEDHLLYPLFYVAGYTGMRRGELCGLRWRDVDFESGRLSVRQQAQIVGGRVVMADLKTDAARRSVAIDRATVAVLRAQRVRQAEWRLALGPGWRDSGLVFTEVDGSPLNPSSVTKTFAALVRASGLPRVTIHGLRHSHTAHLLMKGVPALTVSKRLGHTSVVFTQNRYGHLLPDSQDAVVAAIEGAH